MTDKVAVFDTTLRDGEQAAGSRLGSRDKLAIARQLARLRVDVIEAGYPASSPDDFEAVRRIAGEIEGPVICALSRAVADDRVVDPLKAIADVAQYQFPRPRAVVEPIERAHAGNRRARQRRRVAELRHRVLSPRRHSRLR